MHAVVSHVTIDPSRIADAEKMLHEEVLPMVRAAKGFVSGVWAHQDNGKGVSIATFQTEQDAQGAINQIQSRDMPENSPVTIDSVEVYTVAGTA